MYAMNDEEEPKLNVKCNRLAELAIHLLDIMFYVITQWFWLPQSLHRVDHVDFVWTYPMNKRVDLYMYVGLQSNTIPCMENACYDNAGHYEIKFV